MDFRALAAAGAATAALVALPAAPASAAVRTPAAVNVGAHGTVRGCHWTLRGYVEGDYLQLRLTRDTCTDKTIRFRAAGVCLITGFKAGNWIDDVHQKTSVLCSSAQLFSNYGYDRQIRWPQGRVKFISLD